MRTFAQTLDVTRKPSTNRPITKRHSCVTESQTVDSILLLQRTIGNQVVQRLSNDNAQFLELDSETTARSHVALDSSRIPATRRAARVRQIRLINEPAEKYEQEAVRVAEQVMRMTDPELLRAWDCGAKYARWHQAKDGQEQIQATCVQNSDVGETTAPPIVQEVLSSPGLPLDGRTRRFMESRFGHDFSMVRIHSGLKAAQSSRALHARAYTYGRDIVFGAGRYQPETHSGRALLAHELTHTIQQGQAGNAIQREDSASCQRWCEEQWADCINEADQPIPPEHCFTQRDRCYEKCRESGGAD